MHGRKKTYGTISFLLAFRFFLCWSFRLAGAFFFSFAVRFEYIAGEVCCGRRVLLEGGAELLTGPFLILSLSC